MCAAANCGCLLSNVPYSISDDVLNSEQGLPYTPGAVFFCVWSFPLCVQTCVCTLTCLLVVEVVCISLVGDAVPLHGLFRSVWVTAVLKQHWAEAATGAPQRHAPLCFLAIGAGDCFV